MKTNRIYHPSLFPALIAVIALILIAGCSNAKAQTTALSEKFEGSTAKWHYTNTSGDVQNYQEITDGCATATVTTY